MDERSEDVVNLAPLLQSSARRARELAQRAYAFCFDRTLERPVRWALRVLLVLQIGGVGILAWTHEPAQSYDAHNTVRIASQPPVDIRAVLSEEQNFPLYYDILHVIGAKPNGRNRPVIAFQLLVWLASLAAFHAVAGEFLPRGSWRLLATVLYAATPSIYHYAYYARMYPLMSLLGLLAVWAILRYTSTDRVRWLVLASGAVVPLGFLHPTGPFAALLLCLWTLLVVRSASHAILPLVGTALSFAAAASQAFSKTAYLRLYFGTGVEYVATSSTPFHSFPSRLLFRSQSELDWILYVLAAVLLIAYVRGAPVLGRKHIFLLIFNGLFIALHIVLGSFADSHHYHALTAPFLLAMVIGARQAARSPTWRFLPLCLLAIVGIGDLSFARDTIAARRSLDALARAFGGLEDGALVSDYIVHNYIDRDLPEERHPRLILVPPEVYVAAGTSLKDELLIQARAGGLVTSGISSNVYARKIGEGLGDPHDPLDARLERLLGGAKNVYYVVAPNRKYLFPEELRLFRHYRCAGFTAPSIYRFVRE